MRRAIEEKGSIGEETCAVRRQDEVIRPGDDRQRADREQSGRIGAEERNRGDEDEKSYGRTEKLIHHDTPCQSVSS